MGDERFADDYPPEDAEFYDGEEYPGGSYPTIYDSSRSEGWASDVLRARPARDMAEALDLPAKLLTPEEFMRKYGLGG
jgi:hypothetical protein